MMSDLELVAHAMQDSRQDTAATSRSANPASTHTNRHAPDLSSLPPDIAASLSTLTPTDLAALAPLLSTMSTANNADAEHMSDAEIERLMGEMDAAGGIADSLEGKLDALLASLGEVEGGIQEKVDPEMGGINQNGVKVEAGKEERVSQAQSRGEAGEKPGQSA